MSLDGAAEGVKALWVCVSREIDYQKQLNPNMEALKNRKRALIARNDDIVREVDRGKLEGRSALNEVSNWLQDVEYVKGKVSDIQKNFEEEKKCWNFFKRRKISEESSILIGQLDELITKGKFENGVTIEPLPLETNALPTMPVVGKTADLTRQEIWNCILGTEKRIIGVHGMGGVGKTTIMRNIHNDLSQHSESKHFDCFIWITVSNDVDVNKLQRKIAKELKIDMEEDDDEDGRARKIFNDLKRRKKFLLILDDIWKQFDLVEVGIPTPSEKNGCKVVLTTRDKGVCGQMQAHPIKVRVLSEEESWQFFKDIAVVGGVILSKDIENLARDVAKECCNLPLAIKTVGGSMCGVNNAAVWKDALKDLKEANGEFKGIDKVFTALKFSYTRLCDTVLQSCFLFCSLYPEDHKISANELIDNWICEGLIDIKGTREDNINKGHTILDRLIKVSMLERCDNDEDEIYVKMHDLIRDMAIDITRAEKPRSVIYAGRQLQDFSMEVPEDAMRISLMLNDIKVLSCQPNCQHLLTLFLQGNPLQEISPDSYFNHMCSLRVLNLSSTKIKSLPDSVSNLKQLRALILTSCRTLKEVPSMEKLEELRVLDLSGTKIQELPSGVEAMVYLQRLHLDNTRKLRVFPAGIIPRLSHLEELTMGGSRWKWSSKTGEGARIEEIMNSTGLAILKIQFKELSDFLQHAKSKKWQMKKRFGLFVGTSQFPNPLDKFYCVHISGCNLIGEENSLLLPDTTQWLIISDCQISSLWHFTRLLNKSELYCCQINGCQNMEYLMAEEEPLLPDIKKLTIRSIPELLVLCKGIPSPDALKSLESLHVGFCGKLKYLLPARLLQQLRCLKGIFVWSCAKMKEIVGEEEEMGITREDDNNAMLILSQLQSLVITYLPELKGIFSGVLICNALETIKISDCPELEKLPFSVDNLPCALKEIVGEKEWWNAVEWDHEQTKAHFDSKAKLRSRYLGEVAWEKPEEVTVLDLKGANIRKLPSRVGAMVNLQRLHLDNTRKLHVFPAGIIPRLSHLEELTMGGSRWKWSSKTGEGAGIEEIMNSTRLSILNIQFEELSDFLQHAKSDKWQTMKRFRLAIGRCDLRTRLDRCSLVEIGGCDLIGEENQLLLPDTAQWLIIWNCQISSLWHFTRLLHKSELYHCKIQGCKNLEYLMAEEEPLLPDIKELNISRIPELLVLCKGIPSPDALKSLESLEVRGCGKLKYLLPARLLQQLRCLKSIEVSFCNEMKEMVGEEEEMGITREDDNNAMLILSQLQSLVIAYLPILKGIFSGVLICNALETIEIDDCPELKKLPFSVDNLPCALKEIKGEEEWWDAVEWDHDQTKAHFDSIPKLWSGYQEVPSLEKPEEARVLDLKGYNIRELPSGVGAMVNLQRLHLDNTRGLRVFPAGIIPRLSHLEELTMGGSRWKWSSKTGEGAGIEEIMNSTRLSILNIEFEELSDFLQHAKSDKWQTMKRFRLAIGRSDLPARLDRCSLVEIGGCDLIGEENQLLLPDTAQWLVISNCQISSLWHFTRLLHKSELYRCEIEGCKNMEYLMAEEEPLLPDIKELNISRIPELLVLCKGIPSPDALKSLESLVVHGCDKLKYLLPARLLQQLRCLKSIFVMSCEQMKEIVGEEEEKGITREDDNNAMLILSQLQSLKIFDLRELKGICSRVLICNALETICILNCPELKKLPFSVDNLPCALKEIGGGKEWWDAVEWDHPQTKAHFDGKLWPRSRSD